MSGANNSIGGSSAINADKQGRLVDGCGACRVRHAVFALLSSNKLFKFHGFSYRAFGASLGSSPGLAV